MTGRTARQYRVACHHASTGRLILRLPFIGEPQDAFVFSGYRPAAEGAQVAIPWADAPRLIALARWPEAGGVMHCPCGGFITSRRNHLVVTSRHGVSVEILLGKTAIGRLGHVIARLMQATCGISYAEADGRLWSAPAPVRLPLPRHPLPPGATR